MVSAFEAQVGLDNSQVNVTKSMIADFTQLQVFDN
jgi:hypothetical protein